MHLRCQDDIVLGLQQGNQFDYCHLNQECQRQKEEKVEDEAHPSANAERLGSSKSGELWTDFYWGLPWK